MLKKQKHGTGSGLLVVEIDFFTIDYRLDRSKNLKKSLSLETHKHGSSSTR